MPIALKIDVTKIDKARLFKGAKGTYLDAILIETPESEYGDFMIVQSVSKEEREAGKKGPILGNGKYVGKNSIRSGQEAADRGKSRTAEESSRPASDSSDQPPF